jgi:hypothetical protein
MKHMHAITRTPSQATTTTDPVQVALQTLINSIIAAVQQFLVAVVMKTSG